MPTPFYLLPWISCHFLLPSRFPPTIPSPLTLEPCDDHTRGVRGRRTETEVKEGAGLEEEAHRGSRCLCWTTVQRILNHMQYQPSKVIKPERKNMAQEFWQHTPKAIKDSVSLDTTILLPRIYSKEMIKAVSKDANHSCDHNREKKKKKQRECPH